MKELRDALEERGLDSKGNKTVLKERLMETLAHETNGAPASKTEETTNAQDAVIGNGHINGDIHMVSQWDSVPSGFGDLVAFCTETIIRLRVRC